MELKNDLANGVVPMYLASPAKDWKYANSNMPCDDRDKLRVSNLMMQFDRCGLWTEGRLKKLQEDIRALADAIARADLTLCNDLYRTRVQNAHDILEEVNDIALNWMSEPKDGN